MSETSNFESTPAAKLVVPSEVTKSPEAEKNSLDAILIFGQGPVLNKETRLRADKSDTASSNEIDINLWSKTLATAAAELYKRGQTREFIVLGGRTGGEQYLSEADKISEEMIKNGIPDSAIRREQRSTNTLENITNALNEHIDSTPKYKKLGILGSNFHIPRIKLLMQAFDIPFKSAFSAEEVMRFAARDSKSWDNSALNEIERRLDMSPGNTYYSDKKGEESKPVARKGIEEDVYSRALLTVPENWLVYIARIQNPDRMMNILAREDPQMLKAKFGIDLAKDSSSDIRQKLSSIRRIVLHPDEWGGKDWDEATYTKLNSLLEERREGKEKEDTRVWFMRHAPTVSNKEHRIQGNIQTELIEDEILPYFERMNVKSIPKPDFIVASSLIRSVQTAKALKSHLGWESVNIIVDAHFNERNWGKLLEEKTPEEARQILLQNPDMIKKYPNLATIERLEEVWDDDRDFKASPDAESLNEVRKRAMNGLTEIRNKYPGKKMLIIDHAGVRVSLGLGLDRIQETALKKNNDTVQVVRK